MAICAFSRRKWDGVHIHVCWRHTHSHYRRKVYNGPMKETFCKGEENEQTTIGGGERKRKKQNVSSYVYVMVPQIFVQRLFLYLLHHFSPPHNRGRFPHSLDFRVYIKKKQKKLSIQTRDTELTLFLRGAVCTVQYKSTTSVDKHGDGHFVQRIRGVVAFEDFDGRHQFPM